MKAKIILIILLGVQLSLLALDVTINIDAGERLFEVSPYIYGKNNCFSDESSNAATLAEITRYKDANLRFVHENSGNNATKYNWRKKLASHPNWYNNVYVHNWYNEAKFIRKNFPGLQIMYAFQFSKS